jgi:putative FmdB family regulatory protein
MPIYEYQCRNCGKTFEMLRSLKNADEDLQCPDCHGQEVERRFSSFSAGGCGASASNRFT